MLPFKHSKSPITRLGYSPDGKTLAAACEDDEDFTFCDTDTMSVNMWNPSLEGGILSFSFSPDGKIFAASALFGSVAAYSWPDLNL